MVKHKVLLLVILFATLNCTAQYTTLHKFDDTINGIYPVPTLISDGTFLYGETQQGGTNNYGTIFKIKPDGTDYSKLFDFDSINGRFPYGLISDGTFLYGTTGEGGTHNYGTLFKIKPDGTGYSKVLDFDSTASIGSALVSDGTFLYGMGSGGANGFGTVSKIKFDGTGYSKLLDFNVINGAVLDVYNPLFFDGVYLYGTTGFGGKNRVGNIFKIKSDGTGYANLFDFDSISGKNPKCSLISDGTYLYGTTNGITSAMDTNYLPAGGIFKIKTDGTGYTNILTFNGANGARPYGALFFDGTYLYGTTSDGGSNDNDGVIFKIKPDGTNYSKLHIFHNNYDGWSPNGSLISDGTYLFGTTNFGGAINSGTIFKIGINTIAGIAENNDQTDITIFPNPTTGIINIQLGQLENAQIKICDVLGKSIYQNNSPASNLQIDLHSQTNGVYFISIQTSKGTVNKKVVISH